MSDINIPVEKLRGVNISRKGDVSLNFYFRGLQNNNKNRIGLATSGNINLL